MSDPASDPASIITSIRRTLRVLVAATVVLFVIVVAVAGFSYVNSSDNRDALCALRADIEQRISTSEDFIRENPNGIPGIPAETLRVSVEGQRRTIAALVGLPC